MPKRCSIPRCKNNAASPRAKYCTRCFKKKAADSNSKRKVYGGGGVVGNKNHMKRKVRAGGGGVVGNKGNCLVGHAEAGRRSVLRRSTKMLLVVKNPWLDLILSGTKSWEIRGSQTKQRGKIHLALSGAGGLIVGQCHIEDSFPIDKGELVNHVAKHCIQDPESITYTRPHVWVMAKARRYEKPFVYDHPHGAVKWVKLP